MNLAQQRRSARRGPVAVVFAVLLAGGLAACSSDDGKTWKSWSDKGGKDQVVLIGKDIQALLGATGGSPEVTDRCRHVLDDIKAAKAYRAIPDKTAQSLWQETLDRAQTAATNCTQNTDSLTGGAKLSEVIEAQSSYHLLAQRISDLSAS
ncbi:hypothetical protein [Streptomyces sp. TLI_171]|uniref:hypothetical protein n=1 Tax=Streptomyces sp. TLI_171 TaxID=1938859 RepID=UPI000C18EFA2|nr:hypothetical protein [Streptomyces sp. TLI_171]RKE22908.1 hypothetical protein BX266_6363 [Streptomyces sp. TLI_171]